MPGQCSFNVTWLQRDSYKDWLIVDKLYPSSHARCKICLKSFDIRNMGESALKSHMNGKKHEKLVGQMKFPSVNDSTNLLDPFHKVQAKIETKQNSVDLSGSAQSAIMTPTPDACVPIAIKSDVLSAEVLWAIKICTSHYSHKSSEASDKLFQKMFPDSAIASSFKCGEVKSAYLINHGVAPYFKTLLSEKIKCEPREFVLLFDESMNSKTQNKQMDFHVRLWEGSEVRTYYYHSEFMGHATAEDMVSVFETGTSCLNLNDLLQMSMDGPNVNWKFYEIVQSRLLKETNKSMLNLGSCGLHILHGAFKYGVEASGWNIDEFLKSVHWLLKDTPARREDYRKSVENEPVMPLRFCKTRWTENVPVVERAIEMLPQLRQYIKAVTRNQVTDPKTKTFGVVKESCNDVLIEAKLAFYRYVGKKIQPFLTLYQSDAPMIPFLASDLFDVLKSLMAAVIKEDVMTKASTPAKLCDIDVMDAQQQRHYKKVDIGFSASKIVKKLLQDKKISELREMEFRESAKKFIITVVTKLLDKSPLQYSLVRNMSCLDPRKMATKQGDCKAKMERILTILVQANHFPEDECDEVNKEFRIYLDEVVPADMSRFTDFKPSESRVDTLLYNTMAGNPTFIHLWKVVQQLLLLSHGQATVERGFSINRQIEIENRKEKSYVAQRIVCDHVQAVGGK